MTELASDLATGFSPSNTVRIYRGKPALVGHKPPRDVLSKKELETILLVVDENLTYEELAEARGVAVGTIRTQLYSGYKRLNLVARSQLAGFFPLEGEDRFETVVGKKLSDQSRTQLSILQALSIGRGYKSISMERGIALSTVGTHIAIAYKKWEEKEGLGAVRVANALRAHYIEAIEDHPDIAPLRDVRLLTLPRLARLEPIIQDRLPGI